MDNSNIKTRSKSVTQIKEKHQRPSAAIIEAKKKARLLQQEQNKTQISTGAVFVDPFENASKYINIKCGTTGFVYDELMKEPHNLWDENYPENPKRFTSIFNRCNELGLIDRCKVLQSREATKEEILKKHTSSSFEQLKELNEEKDNDKLLQLSTAYDAVYIHPKTFRCATLAAGCCIDLVDNILNNNIQNGFALVRPPGHHAMENTYCGYCFFNNVALAAVHAIENHNLQRILIVDFDVHHGQATQQMFFNDPRVVYFSIHRYEHGYFWPNLRESEFDAIGFGKGAGYNFNVPLNKVGMGNSEYLSIFHQVLLPMAYEFNPELVLVSAGFDASIGCPEGEMEVTPPCYAHLIGSLMPLAMGKIAVILEGGYCIPSLSEGAALSLRALLGDPTPGIESLSSPCLSVTQSIMNVIYTHNNLWNCYKFYQTYNPDVTSSQGDNDGSRHIVHHEFYGKNDESVIQTSYPVANCYPIQNQDFVDRINKQLTKLKIDTNLTQTEYRVGYVYDPRMLKHQHMFSEHVECPNRIKGIYEKMKDNNILERCFKINSRLITDTEISMVHDDKVLEKLLKLDSLTPEEVKKLQKQYNSVYFCKDTIECAKLSAGSVLETVKSVVSGVCRSGVCIVRPPGHHAEPDQPCGFCILNNVALGAQYAIKNMKLKKVLIFDWDVHHGNGTQHAFENNSNVLYISVHRYDNGKFFPDSEDANYDVVGTGIGIGYNVNIPWNKKGMGDAEYMAVFHQIVMPISYEFNPDLVFVSAGFDAAIGDPLGGCKVSPETYGHMTHHLSLLAKGNIVVVLEGGYNVETISLCMAMCTKALLGDPLPPLAVHNSIETSAQETIFQVLKTQSKFWRILSDRLVALPVSSSLQTEYFNQDIYKDNYDLKVWKLSSKRNSSEQTELKNNIGTSSKNDIDILTKQFGSSCSVKFKDANNSV